MKGGNQPSRTHTHRGKGLGRRAGQAEAFASAFAHVPVLESHGAAISPFI